MKEPKKKKGAELADLQEQRKIPYLQLEEREHVREYNMNLLLIDRYFN